MSEIDVDSYFTDVVSRIQAIEVMFTRVFRKQASDLGIGNKASASQIDELANRTSAAMEFFVGDRMKKNILRVMRSELKKRDPVYFQKKYGI
jgi:hypothetical protein